MRPMSQRRQYRARASRYLQSWPVRCILAFGLVFVLLGFSRAPDSFSQDEPAVAIPTATVDPSLCYGITFPTAEAPPDRTQVPAVGSPEASPAASPVVPASGWLQASADTIELDAIAGNPTASNYITFTFPFGVPLEPVVFNSSVRLIGGAGSSGVAFEIGRAHV